MLSIVAASTSRSFAGGLNCTISLGPPFCTEMVKPCMEASQPYTSVPRAPSGRAVPVLVPPGAVIVMVCSGAIGTR